MLYNISSDCHRPYEALLIIKLEKSLLAYEFLIFAAFVSFLNAT